MLRPGLDALARALDDDIIAISGGKLRFKRAGTSDPLEVYDSPDLDSTLGYLITADAAGVFPAFWFDPANDYDAVLEQADGTPIKVFSNISVGTTPQSGRRAENGAPSYALFDYMAPTDRAAVLARNFTGDVTADMQEAVDAADLIMLHSASYPQVGSVTGDRYTFYGEARFAESLHPYGQGGAVIELTSEDNTPFFVGEGVTHQALTLYYPDQVDTTDDVIRYPPTYTNIDDETVVAGFELKDIVVLGAYDFIKFGGVETFNVAGQIDLTGVRAAILNVALDLTHVTDTIHFINCKWSYGVMGDAFNHYGLAGADAILNVTAAERTSSTATITLDANHGRAIGDTVTVRNMTPAGFNVENAAITGVPAANKISYAIDPATTTPATGFGVAHVFPMRDFYRDNATFMRAHGDGDVTTLSSVSIDGVTVIGNHFLGQKRLFHVIGEGADPVNNPTGGFLHIVNMTGCIVDQVQEFLLIEPGGAVSTFNITGMTGFQLRVADLTWCEPYISIEDPAPGPGNVSLATVRMSAVDMGFMAGTFSDISGDYFRNLTIDGFTCPACIHTTSNGDRVFHTIDSPDADIVLTEHDAAASHNATGKRTFLHIVQARSALVQGTFEDWDNVIRNDDPNCAVDVYIDTFGDLDDAITGNYAGNVRVDPRSHIESMPTLAYQRGDTPTINGGFDVWQRGTSFVSGASKMTADRWKFVRASAVAGATLSRQAGFNDARYCARIQRDVDNTGVEAIRFTQQIETQDCYQYQGSDFFIGFDVRKGANFSAADGILTVTVYTGTGADEVVSAVAGFTTGNLTQTKTVALGSTGERFVVGPFPIADNVTEIAYDFSFVPVGTALAADYAEVTRVSAGHLATAQDYVDRPFQQEIALCRRFCRKSFLQGTTPAQNVGAGTGEERFYSIAAAAVVARRWIAFDSPMFGTPQVTLYNPAAANAEVRDLATTSDCTGSTTNVGTANGFQIVATQPAGAAVGDTLCVHWLAEILF